MTETTPLLETQAAFARRLGVNKSTITRAAQMGRLVFVGKQVDIAASLARWQATQGHRTDLAEKHAQQRVKKSKAIPHPTPGQKNATSGDLVASVGIATEDASRQHYKALTLRFENEMIKLEMLLRRHQRYRLPAVCREAHSLGLALRAAIERMVDQTAPRLAALAASQRLALLATECCAIARSTQTERVRALRRLRQSEKPS